MLRVFVLRGEPQAQSLWAFLKQNWKSLADQGKPLSVTVTEHKSKRSGEQNRRYWSVMNEIADQAYIGGQKFSADAWHEYAKRKFIGCEDLPGGGQIGISTTALSVAEFCDYMTKVEAYAATELGVEIRF
jgi:hypothetical protein